MKRNKRICFVIELIILVFVLFLGFTVLNAEYLFDWAAHNWTFYILLGLIALFFLIIDKQYISIFMTAGIIIGIFIGNYLGRFIRGVNESKIVEGMNAEDRYRLRHNPGFEIWLGVILIFVITGIIVQIISSKKKVVST